MLLTLDWVGTVSWTWRLLSLTLIHQRHRVFILSFLWRKVFCWTPPLTSDFLNIILLFYLIKKVSSCPSCDHSTVALINRLNWPHKIAKMANFPLELWSDCLHSPWPARWVTCTPLSFPVSVPTDDVTATLSLIGCELVSLSSQTFCYTVHHLSRRLHTRLSHLLLSVILFSASLSLFQLL